MNKTNILALRKDNKDNLRKSSSMTRKGTVLLQSIKLENLNPKHVQKQHLLLQLEEMQNQR